MRRLPLVSPLERALFLKAQPYLAGLAPRAIAAFAEYTEEMSFAPGDVVFEAGGVPDRLYFLASGSARTEYATGESFEIHAPGGIGLVEFLARSDHPPRVTASEEIFALGLGTDELMQLVEDDFVLYETLARSLSQAVRETAAALPPEQRAESGFGQHADSETVATLDLVHRIARARQAPFFQDSSLTVMTQLLRFQEPSVLQPGQALWQRGATAGSLAVVLDGRFETRAADGGRTEQPTGAVLGAFEVFGCGVRQDSAVALCPTRVLEIERSLFTDMLEDHFEFAKGYFVKLARRLIALRSRGRRAQRAE